MPDSSENGHPLIGVGRVIAALLVTYVFLILLMTVSAQQSIDAQLKGINATYSSAREGLQAAKQWEERKAQAEKAVTGYERKLASAVRARSTASAAYNRAIGQFEALMPALRNAGCDQAMAKDPLVGWDGALQCMESGLLAKPTADALRKLADRKPSLPDLAYDWNKATDDEVEILGNLRAAQAWRAEERAGKPDGVRYQPIFSDLAVFKEHWWLLGHLTNGFSPALLQIILALASGAFGALLITLIFIVYPKNSLGLSRGEGFGARLLLGGLISVCTYIVLGGGAAILGANNAFGQGQTNFMTFCAVGVLAGMFSDRVAAWLSDRSELVFASLQDSSKTANSGRPQPSPQQPAQETKKDQGETGPG